MLKKLLLIFFLSISFVSFAQEGVWNPADADYSFPRTMLKSSEIEMVQNTLSEPTMLKGAGVADNLLINSRIKLQEFAGNLYDESTKEYPIDESSYYRKTM